MSIVISGTTGIDAGSLPVANTGKISAGSGLPVILNTTGVDRVTVDTAGNVGIGIVPSTYHTGVNLQIGVAGAIRSNNGTSYMSVMSNSAGGKFINNDYAAVYEQVTGAHYWYTSGSSGIAGATIPWSSAMVLDTSGNLVLTKGTGGLGYGTGSGGTVTQLTSKSTAVSIVPAKPSGRITTHNAVLASGAEVAFVLNNSLLTYGDGMLITPSDVSDNYSIKVRMGIGLAVIFIKNVSGGSLSDSINFNFQIIKGATA